MHSAGSNIRRDQYNKLLDDIKENVREWAPFVSSSSLLLWMQSSDIQTVLADSLGEAFKLLIALNFQIDDVNSEALDKCVDTLTATPCRTWT